MSIGNVDEEMLSYGVDSVVKLTCSEGGVVYGVDSIVKFTGFDCDIFGCGYDRLLRRAGYYYKLITALK